MKEIFLDVKIIMWILTLVGIALIKFNDMQHLSTSFKEMKDDIKSILDKIDFMLEKIESNKEKITEIDVRCEEREKRYNQFVLACSKDKKTSRKKRRKTQK